MKIVRDLSSSDYRKSDGISKSMLDIVHKSPSLVEWNKNAPVDNDKLTTLDFGTAAHYALLEPQSFDERYVVAPAVDKRTNAGKQELAEFTDANKESEILSSSDYKKLLLMRDSALAHPDFARLYNSGFNPEQSIYWEHSATGILCKCRPDLALKKLPIIIDIKTKDNIAFFGKSVAEYRYHVQDAHYTRGGRFLYGGELPDFYFLAISKTINCGKYPVRLFRLHQNDKDQGLRERNADLETINVCQTMDDWSGVDELRMPRWARDEFNREVIS